MRTPKSFEEGMERLNTILVQMQSEETTLAYSVKLYAEAASLMEYCHAALEKTSLQISEIADRLNFPSQTAFGYFFKRETGMTPTQYRSRQ